MQQNDVMQELVVLFKRFPGIGQRQAERFARCIASEQEAYVQQLARTLLRMREVSRQCKECFVFHEGTEQRCAICSGRKADTLVIVEKDGDIDALEASTVYTKQTNYFVLGGLLPIVSKKKPAVRIDELKQVVEKKKPKEILIALSAHPDADHTSHYLTETLKTAFPHCSLSVLGRGLSSGSELEYMDPNTLTEAFKGRNTV